MLIGRPSGNRDSRGGWDRVCRSRADYVSGESAILPVAEDDARLGSPHRRRNYPGPRVVHARPCRAALIKSLPRVCPCARVFLSTTTLRAGDSSDRDHREERAYRRGGPYRTVLL